MSSGNETARSVRARLVARGLGFLGAAAFLVLAAYYGPTEVVTGVAAGVISLMAPGVTYAPFRDSEERLADHVACP